MKTCLVAMIVYRHVPVATLGSIMALNYYVKNQLIDLIEGKIDQHYFLNKSFIPDIYYGGDDALVGRGRSMIMQYFLNKNYDFGIFVDQDIVWHVQHLHKLYNHLKSGKYEFIGANYPTKHGSILHKCYSASRPEFGATIRYHKDALPVKVKWLAGGCFAITRDAVLKIIKHHNIQPMHKGAFYPLFETSVKKDEITGLNDYYLSEDYYFCQLAKDAGIDVWLDPSIYDLKHLGEFQYTLSDTKLLHTKLSDFEITEKPIEK